VLYCNADITSFCVAHMLQLSVDDISLNADVYGDRAENNGNYNQLKVLSFMLMLKQFAVLAYSIPYSLFTCILNVQTLS